MRVFEERVVDEYRARRIPGFTHPYVGQEAVAAGVCGALQPHDLITSTHRGHGHALAKGVDMSRFMAELFGRESGVCRGRGGSMHVADFQLGMLGANGIVGGGFGLAVGAALAAQLLGTGQVVACFFGDGAINKGTFHESMNYAAVAKLPVVFVCEANGYAQWTATERLTSVTKLEHRARAYGIRGIRVDGNDVLAVHAAARRLVTAARRDRGPALLVAYTYRLMGHSVGDAEAYRGREEVEERRRNDPIGHLEALIIADSRLSRSELDADWADARSEVESAVRFAEESPFPLAGSAMNDVYTEPFPVGTLP